MNPLIEALVALVDNAIPWRLFLASYPRPPYTVDEAIELDMEEETLRAA
jgi:hypothetical protein